MTTGIGCNFFPWTLILVIIFMVYSAGGTGAAGAARNSPQPSAGMGTLTGVVVRGPVSPVERVDGPPSVEPVEGARVIVRNPSGQEISQALTNKEGKFQLSLPPGSYQVDQPSLGRGEFSKDLPAKVTISPGKETRLEIRIDTRIR